MDGKRNDQYKNKKSQSGEPMEKGSAGGESSREYRNPDLNQDNETTVDEKMLEE